VTSELSESVSVYSINSTTGAMALASVVGIGDGAVTGVVVDPTGRFAYVGTSTDFGQFSGENAIRTYAINPNTGFLTEVPGSRFPVGPPPGYPAGMVIHPSGKFLFVADFLPNYAPNSFVLAFSIDPTTGALTQLPGSPYPTGINTSSVTTDPAGKFLFVADGASCDIIAYSINADTGALTAVPGSPFATKCPDAALDAVDPTGRFLYVSNWYSGYVSAYGIDGSTGALTPVPGSPFSSPSGSSTNGVAIDPTGHFLYVANYGSNTVSGYAIDAATGALSALSASPFPEAGLPYYAAIDPSGNFLYVTNSGPGNISAYRISANTGALTPVPGSPFAVGSGPDWISFASETVSSQLTVQPASGGNTGTVTANVLGGGLVAGAQVKLVATGQPDIVGTNVSLVNATALAATFDLTGATAGLRDVVVTEPNGIVRTLLKPSQSSRAAHLRFGQTSSGSTRFGSGGHRRTTS